MKHKIILTLFLHIHFCSANAQETTQEKQDRLAWARCGVKTITTTETDYSYFGAKLQAETPFITSKSTCDKSGNISVAKDYNKRGTIETWYKFEYEKPGIPGEITVYNPDGSVSAKAMILNNYDSLGRHSSSWSFLHDSVFLSKDIYTYDSFGNLELSSTYEAFSNDRTQSQLTNSVRYKYDSKGRIIEATTHKEGSSYDLTTTFKYGADGKVSEKNNGNVGVFTYGANGLCTSIKYYNSSNVLQYMIAYTYEYYGK